MAQFIEDPFSGILENEGEPRIIDTIFNVTGLVSNLFNNSNNALLIYVGGVILFIVALEIVLFALDVYYNQTYPKYFKQRLDTDQGPHSIYEDYPPYPDAFLSTYRAFDNSKWSMTKILEWIAMLNDSYDFADSTLHQMECQKRAVCELWKSENGFKGTNIMDSLLEMSPFFNLSDDIIYVLDEMGDARDEATVNKVSCEEMYSDCPSSTIVKLRDQLLNLII